MLFALGAQVVHVHVAMAVAGGDHHIQSCHLRAGRVGAVGRGGNQANMAVALTVRRVVGAYHQQARVFALAARIGLQADSRIARGLAQPLAQLRIQQRVALALVGGREGVDVGELRPGDGNHLAGGVELHGAGAQRNHAAVQRQVFVAQASDVTQHAGLGLVAVEHRVRQKAAAAAQRLGDQRGDARARALKGG